MLAALIGFLGNFGLAEEATQEAFAVASERWPHDGVPTNPGGWLVSTARNRAIVLHAEDMCDWQQVLAGP